MSAVPKKKLCWNCEGNVAKGLDNCPYCGVYLHETDIEDDTLWNPNYSPKAEEEEENVSYLPFYQVDSESEESQQKQREKASKREANSGSDESPLIWKNLFVQLKQDVFPLLFMMMGSIFFLFGAVLLLFSQDGTLTLQWRESDGLFFFCAALPLIFFGWRFFQQVEDRD